MIATCQAGGCDWSIRDQDIVEITAFAEVHRATNHDWIRPGRCHRLELDADERAAVDGKLAEWEAVRSGARQPVGAGEFTRR